MLERETKQSISSFEIAFQNSLFFKEKKEHDSLPQQLEQDEFKNLFHYIAANKELPGKLAEIKADNEKVNELLLAISKGESGASIFSENDCHVYLLYLMQQKKISFSVGMTVYAYVMALMQFTEQQPLRAEEKDVRLVRPIKVDTLVKSGEITAIGQQFINKLCDRFKEIGYIIDKDSLQKSILQLSPVEQWLVKLPFVDPILDEDKEKQHDADRILTILRKNMPFIIDDDNIEKNNFIYKGHYWVPSVTLINYLLKEISKNPIHMLPIFGSIGIDSLRTLHQADFHPVALYSPYVKSNPKNADSYRCGPYLMWLHDIAHTFWGSMLEPDDRLFIFSQYVPQMESLKKEAQECKDSEMVTFIGDMIRRACDFDLSGIDNFINKENRLRRYLYRTWNGRTFQLYNGGVEFLDIGACKEDRFYFLMLKLHYNNPFPTLAVRLTWCDLIHQIQMGTGAFYRRQEVVDTLNVLALSAANPLEPADRRFVFIEKTIDWSAWQALLDKSKPAEMWQLILHPSNYARRKELSVLAFHHKIVLFEPYCPITSEKIEQLRSLIEENVSVQKNQIYDQVYSYRRA
jgi:hypothetical protein